ncbi:tryptophan 2,3-dioxygenase [Catenulispora sp. GP43]|uniref:tryptophan 2,3-dioxygenase family protein n=1 Tax=Catenulispora sp. GP43 TaxID=3156263 RepID=UPI0035117E7F
MAGYSEYLKLDELLTLQQPRSRSGRTELAFILVHQVCELWFKLMITDLGLAIGALDEDDPATALRCLRRVHEVERLLIEQLILIDHLEPGGFADMRPALGTASAAESQQFATIVALSTSTRRTPQAPKRVRDLWSAFCDHLERAGFDMPAETSEAAGQHRMSTVVRVYREERGLLAELCEALLDHDHALVTWRHRHVLAAARHIGENPGTGGTDGVAYLQRSLSRRLYPELWSARTSFEATVPV